MTSGEPSARVWMLTPVAERDRALFLSRLRLQAAEEPMPGLLRCVAVFQSADPADAAALEAEAKEILADIIVLHQPEPAVSRARNRALDHCLERAAPTDYVILRDCRSLIDRQFLVSLLAEAPEVGRAARILWAELPAAPVPGSAFLRTHHDPIGHPYLARLAFRRDLLSPVWFREDIGPGTATGIKAGEDVLFLADLFRTRGDWTVTDLPGALVQAPRQDSADKRRAYASGQVHAARTLIADRRLPPEVRRWARLRLLFFALGTLRFLRPGSRAIFSARLSALLDRPEP